MRGQLRRRVASATFLALLASGCATTDHTSPESMDPYTALRGLVLQSGDLAPPPVVVGEPLSVPPTAPAYLLEPGRTEDLRALAEKYAGGPVTEELGPGFSGDLISFSTGDGWFTHATGGLNADTWNGDGWGWTDAAWRHEILANPKPETFGPCSAEPGPHIGNAVEEFYDRVGVPVELVLPIEYCVGDRAIVYVVPLVDGLPLIGTDWGYPGASVDPSGTVVEASGPLLRLTSIGKVELAPAGEVLRRLVHGPGRLTGNCFESCTLNTDGARLALTFATNGGLGSNHDHTPGGVVDEPASQVLVPAIRVPGDRSYPGSLPGVSYSGAFAISSALLVDDPAQAEAARRTDATSADPTASGPACAGEPAEFPLIAVCTSQPQPTAGVPVLLTAYGERYEPVGAGGCEPLFSLDPGDGTGAQSFRPRSGTLITARVAHTYTDPGTYTAEVRSASRCSTPASPGGSEPEFDLSAQIVVTVTE